MAAPGSPPADLPDALNASIALDLGAEQPSAPAPWAAPPLPAADAEENQAVKVAVRIRPFLAREMAERSTSCVTVLSDTEIIMGAEGAERQFTFDHVLAEDTAQEQVYSTCVSPLVEKLFLGYNATVLAYGQTGSGKTFTMGSGSTESVVDDKDLGVIPRATVHIFNLIAAKKQQCPSAEFYLRAQFLEIYGETVRDLLDPAGTAAGKQVSIRDGTGSEVTVSGAREESVKSPSDMLACLERGTLVRTTGSTDMNAHSSRSHAIFSVILEQHIETDGETEFRTAKFHFVDLAGSERAKRTRATGVRMKEGININMGLLALGNVISALGDSSKQAKHVPYRDSKLTRMLQDSLGGNSRTLMIACISAADVNFEETLNALRYANRARNIQNRAVVNRDPATSQIVALKQQVAQLKAMLGRGEFSDEANGRLRAAEDEIARLNGLLANECKARRELEERLRLAASSRVPEALTDEEEPLPEDVLQALQLPSAEEDDEDEGAAHLRRQFEASQHALRAMVSSYDSVLQAKLEAVRQISEERSRYEAMKANYEAKMAELDAEVRETAKERNLLADKLKDVESLAQQTEATRQQQAKLRTMVADKDKRLRELEDRSRQLEEARKAVAEWQRKESLVRQEIEHTRRDKVEATRKLAENAKRFAEELKAHRNEIAHLLKDKARLAQDATAMSLRSERDAKLLQQKSEQVAAMQRKLREAQRLTAMPAQLAERAKAQRVQLEKLAQEQLRREEELADLRRALSKKEEAIARRDALLAELERLKQQDKPAVLVSMPTEACGEDVAEMEQRLEATYCEIVFRDRQMEQLAGDHGEPSWLEIGSLDQASEVIAALMQLFVESKQEARLLMQTNEQLRAQLVAAAAVPSITSSASSRATPEHRTPSTPDSRPTQAQQAASQVRIRNIEERLRAMQVDSAGARSPRPSQRRSSQAVWDRLTSPSGYTGIHKHNVNFRRQTEQATGAGASGPVAAPAAAIEETVLDELVVVSDEDDDKHCSVITAIFAEAQAGGAASPKHAQAQPVSGWERVAAQSTESYTNKRTLDAEARKRVKSPTTRKLGKENLTKERGSRFLTGTQKQRMTMERARRKLRQSKSGTPPPPAAGAAVAAIGDVPPAPLPPPSLTTE